MAEADAEQRHLAGEGVHQLHVPGLGGVPRPGAEHHRVRPQGGELLGGPRPGTDHHGPRAEGPQVLVDDVGETVVRVDEQDLHGSSSVPVRAQNVALILASVSRHSAPGVESATTPADAWVR